jgi:PST family polysaccharide transporter
MDIKRIKSQKVLIESYLSLSILNGLNIILPLLTLPYILRIVGPTNYGVYAFISVLIHYCLLINSYGFNLSATKQVSQHRNDIYKLSRIYSSVIVDRLILAFISFILLFSLSFLFISTRIEFMMLIWGVGIVVGDTFVPIWLFQGVEKMRYLTIVNVASKVVFTILIFIFIRESSDFRYIIILNSLGYIIAGVFSTVLVRFFLKIKFIIPNYKELIYQFKEGSALFGSTVGMELYRNANIFILRFFVSDSAVGIYAASEKVIKGIQMAISPIAQALFPHLSYKFKQQTLRDNLVTIKKITVRFIPIVLTIAICTYIMAPWLSTLLCGNDYYSAVKLIRIMTPVIFFGGFNYLLGIVGLVNLNKQNDFFKYVLFAGLVSVLFLLLTVGVWGNSAAAGAMALSEIVLFCFCIWSFFKLARY